MSERKAISPAGAARYYKDWRFSPAVACGGFVFVSGCTGTLDNGSVPEGVTAQTRQAFARIKTSLDEAGVGFADIVEMTTYHVGLSSHLVEFRAAKDEFIVEPYPAWTALGVTELASQGAVVEISVIARCREF